MKTHTLTLGHGLLGVTTIACLAVLFISTYPGALDDLVFLGVIATIASIPIFGVVGLIVWMVLIRRKVLKKFSLPWRLLVGMATIVFASYLLLTFYVPCRITFLASRSAFETFLAQAPRSSNGRMTLNQKLGWYEVDEYAVDSRGGIYFRVYSRGSLGPDLTSYGFTHQPNQLGSPFGAAGYQVFHLVGYWYWFRASDDWFLPLGDYRRQQPSQPTFPGSSPRNEKLA